MYHRKQWTLSIAVAALALIGGGTLLAEQAKTTPASGDGQLVKLLNDNHTSLAKAIAAAEQHSKGQAISAAAHMQGGDAVVNVSVVAGETTHHLIVNVKTGKVSEPVTGTASAGRTGTQKP